MAPKTAPETEADAHAGGQSPVNTDAVELAGATRFGVAVEEMILKLSDGRRVRIELPTPTAADLSELAERMVDALRKVNGWVNGAALAMILDPTGDTECHSGSFKRAVSELKRAGLIRTNKQYGYRAK